MDANSASATLDLAESLPRAFRTALDYCRWMPMRLFRQPALHDWQSVVDRVIRCRDEWP
jgi:hypothetical protein